MNRLIILAVILVFATFGCTTTENNITDTNDLDLGSSISVDQDGYSNLSDYTKAKVGDTVSVNYTGKLLDGNIFDSSEGREPLTFVAGAGQMIKGFDAAVIGMKVGDKKTITLEPSEAYGELNLELVVLDATQFADVEQVEVGMTFFTQTGLEVEVISVDGNNVSVTQNHNLAGKTLIFEIEMMEIK